jgi:hypothetical protein
MLRISQSYLAMRLSKIRAVQKVQGHKSLRTKEVYACLSDKHFHHAESALSSPNMATVLICVGIFCFDHLCCGRHNPEMAFVFPAELGGAIVTNHVTCFADTLAFQYVSLSFVEFDRLGILQGG